MRDIKFRVWCGSKNEMLEVQKHSFKTNKSMPYGWNMQYDFGELMQYTGLKDLNGKEVYEGDILLYKNRYKTIVGYKNGSFTRSYHQGNTYLLYDSFIEDGIMIDYEIIGNIYENADLLKD